MNKFIEYLAIGALTTGGIMAFTTAINEKEVIDVPASTASIEIPDEVNAVLQDHCFGCHNTESRNEKGRDKLSIDQLGDLSKGKLAAKLNKMVEELEEGKMPPEKFLEKYPEKEPSKEARKTVIKWAKSTVKDL